MVARQRGDGMKPIGTGEILTPRLRLRRLCAADIAALRACGSLAGSEEEASARMRRFLAEYRKPFTLHWVIECEGKAVGRVRAWDVDPFNGNCQLGYDIAPACRGQGLMTEAVRAVIAFLFERAEVHRVYCHVRTENIASARVCEKAGMAHEGTLRAHYKNGNKFDDVHIYGIVSEEDTV